jgi:hypothetical protein
LRRDYIGVELNEKYIKDIAEPFVNEVEKGIPLKEQRQGQMSLLDLKD